MKSLNQSIFLIPMALLALSNSAFAVGSIAFTAGSSTTITYTAGSSVSTTLATNQPFPASPAVIFSYVGGSLPTGISVVPKTDCGGSLCLSFSGSIPSGYTEKKTATIRGTLNSESATISVTFAAPLLVTGTLINAGQVGSMYSSSLTKVGGTGSGAWTVATGSLPPGLLLSSSTGVLSGTPTEGGEYTFSLRFTDTSVGAATSSSQSIFVIAPLVISAVSMPATTVGAAYSQTPAWSGGYNPWTWSVSTGSLPPGLSISSSTGLISGSATTAGESNFTVQVACCGSDSASKALSITVNPAPTISTTSLPVAIVDQPYSTTLSSANGTGAHTWSIISGGLPCGLSLNSTTGVISGTADYEQLEDITVKVTDAVGASATQQLQLKSTVSPQITTTSLAPLTVGQDVSTTLALIGGTGPYTWSVSEGSLPDGLALAAGTGAITGSPSAGGAPSFTVRVVDANTNDDTQALTWIVNEAPIITTNELSATTLDRPIAATLTATGGTGALTWSATGLPVGVTLSALGVLSGTPTEAGVADALFEAIDTNDVKARESLSLLVNPPVEITESPLRGATLGEPYARTMTRTGGTAPFGWIIATGSLPAGLSLSTAGLVSGTPTTLGDFSVTVQVTDAAGSQDTLAFTMSVTDPVVITTSSFSAATEGQVLSESLALTGGQGPHTWSMSSGSAPPGVTLNPSTGTLSGQPPTSGTFEFTLQATDSEERTGIKALSWLVNPPPQITTLTLPTTSVGVGYSFTLQATGGTAELEWSGADFPPANLAIHPTSALLSGTFMSSGPKTFTISATDVNGVTGSQTFTVEVAPTLEITTAPQLTLLRGQYGSTRFRAIGGIEPLQWTAMLPSGLEMRSEGFFRGIANSVGSTSTTLRVIDAQGTEASQEIEIVVEEPASFRVTPSALQFNAAEGDQAPAPQQVTVMSTPANQAFDVAVDAEWLNVSFDQSTTPAILTVSAATTELSSGEYSTTITFPGRQAVVSVALTVAPAEDPTLTVVPSALTFSGRAGGESISQLAVVELTGAPEPLTVEVTSDAPWLSASSRVDGDLAALSITADPQALEDGDYEGALRIAAGDMVAILPVELMLADGQFELSHSGLTFEAAEDAAEPPSQALRILHGGPSSLPWLATAVAPWLLVEPATGTADPLSEIQIRVSPAGLEPGVHSGAVSVSAQPDGPSRVSEIRLSLGGATPRPQASPTGLVFHVVDGETTGAQQITLSNNSDAPLEYVSALMPSAAAGWVTLTPASGVVPAGGTATLTVQATPLGPAAGAEDSWITIGFSEGTAAVIHVSMITTAATCEPTRLLPVLTRMGDHFQVRAAWPTAVEVLVVDDCGQIVSDGAALLRFSDVDEPGLPLVPSPDGLWTGTWTPTTARSSITATVSVESGAHGLLGSVQATGTVDGP